MRYVIPALLLAGCATSQQVQDSGERQVRQLTRPPALAAGCLARNIENDRPVYGSVPVRPLDKADSWEVIYRGGPETVIAVIHVEPDGAGSRATIWMKAEWFYRRGELIPAMIKGC